MGKSADCRQCGNRELGSNGQFWNILVGQGWVGVFCYNAFFLWCLWRFRHDHYAIGIAGSLVLILMLFFQFLYGSLNTTLAYALISVALLARNDSYVQAARAAAATARAQAASAGLRGRLEGSHQPIPRAAIEGRCPLMVVQPPAGGDARAAYLPELASLVWPAPADAALRRGGRAGYAVVPSAARPRLLVPAGARRAAASAIRHSTEAVGRQGAAAPAACSPPRSGPGSARWSSVTGWWWSRPVAAWTRTSPRCSAGRRC